MSGYTGARMDSSKILKRIEELEHDQQMLTSQMAALQKRATEVDRRRDKAERELEQARQSQLAMAEENGRLLADLSRQTAAMNDLQKQRMNLATSQQKFNDERFEFVTTSLERIDERLARLEERDSKLEFSEHEITSIRNLKRLNQEAAASMPPPFTLDADIKQKSLNHYKWVAIAAVATTVTGALGFLARLLWGQ